MNPIKITDRYLMPERLVQVRRYYCTHCGKALEVSPKAFSVSCPHCYNRVSIEDHMISSHHAITNIETCGSVAVTPSGDVRAQLRVHDLQIEGRLRGNVIANGKVSVSGTARIVGDVYANRLEVRPGAHLSGFFTIGSKRSAIGN